MWGGEARNSEGPAGREQEAFQLCCKPAPETKESLNNLGFAFVFVNNVYPYVALTQK